jgi:hypothetical protein
MTDAEHPIDMLDEPPEGDAVEQQQTAADPVPVSADLTTDTATDAEAAEQGQTMNRDAGTRG